MTNLIRWLLALLVTAAACAGVALLAASSAGRTPAAQNARAAVRHVSAPATGAVSIKGRSDLGMAPRCTPAPIGFIGLLRSGDAARARHYFGGSVVATLDEPGTGVLDLVRTPDNSARQMTAGYFARWSSVLAQSRQPRLQSCDILLADRPADKPLIDAAVAAVVRHGFTDSARQVRASLQEVLVSDDPLQPGLELVTLMVPGAAYHPANTPVLHHLSSYTAVVSESTHAVAAVVRGGF
jgi:hypothetical protein